MTVNRFDLYGTRRLDVEEARTLVSDVIDVELRLHDSSYQGEYYGGRDSGGRKIRVKVHGKDDEGYLDEEDFPDYKTLIYISGAASEDFPVLAGMDDIFLLRTDFH
ncbi:hypothetical protein [Amycolatopsis sp. NPDC059021]|uniref:hypothetical protein n=1 Tax=Amycolatopsis sp. NPDC059021 TaxID=3346704 RepID=UPI00366CE085